MKRSESDQGPERRSAPCSGAMAPVLHPTHQLLRWAERHGRGFYAAVAYLVGRPEPIREVICPDSDPGTPRSMPSHG